jgi:hypothetical protein
LKKKTKNINKNTNECTKENVASRMTLELGDNHTNVPNKEKNKENKNAPMGTIADTIKYNLVEVHQCSKTLNQWKDKNDIYASVYSLVDPNNDDLHSSSLSSDDSQNTDCFLFYSHVAQLPEMDTGDLKSASNKEDILRMTGMLLSRVRPRKSMAYINSM